MSMPKLPEENNINREEAVNLILTSIAMEELGLSHILNAEGEKLQYVLGTTKGAAGLDVPATVEDILGVNKSVRQTLSNATRLQMMLGAKMESAMSTSTMQGPTGPEGPMGPPGPQGPPGPVGTILDSYDTLKELKDKHPDGNQGDAYLVNGDLYVWNTDTEEWQPVGHLRGPQGSMGPQGEAGPEGSAGPEGPQGVQGIAGTVGTIKASYETVQALRDAHPTGDPGDFYYVKPDLWVWDEDIGDWINVGEIAGPEGVQGLQGPKGDPGSAGPAGPQGVAGPQGAMGSRGPEGPTGPTGPIGPRGLTGPKGETGENGKDGEAATIEPGKVTMLPFGEPPTVENVGTSSNAIFNFGIPEGPPRVRVYRANLSTTASPPLQIPLGNAMYYQLQYSNGNQLSLFFRPLTGLAQARCDYRILSQYDAEIIRTFDVYQGNNAVFIQGSPAIDGVIYNNTRETHKTWIRVQDPNNAALWSTYEVNLFSSQNGARTTVWVNVIEEGVSY